MKPSKHNNPDSWRRDDVNLRCALQQRNDNLPLLPEGFADRLMERIEEEEAAAKAKPAAKTKRRYLWPIVGTALSTAALLTLVFILNRPSNNSQSMLAEEKVEEVNETYEVHKNNENNESNVNNEAHETDETHEVKKGKNTYKAHRAYTANRILTTHTTHQSHPDNDNEPANEPSQAADTSATTSPAASPTLSPVDLDHLDHLVADAVKDKQNHDKKEERGAREEHKTSRQLLALAVNVGTAGGLTSGGVNEETDVQNFSLVVNKQLSNGKPANYYFPAGNGYTYAYSSFSTWDKDGTDGKDVTAGKDATQGTSVVDLSNYLEAAVQYANSLQPVDDSHHHLPVTFGVSIGIPLNQRFTLESGITYTRLVSTFDHGTQASYEHSRQQVHYLGIPVRAQVLIFDRRHWNIYASLGGSIELPVSTLVTHRTITSKSSESLPDTHPTAPTQFAIGGGLGVQYSITRHIGIYAEPQLQWFIPTDSELKTYRTEHPLRFVPSLGLRWTL